MEFKVDLEDWSIKDVEGEKKISGEYSIKSGAMVIAKQTFNTQYASVKLPFSPKLVSEALELTEKIKSEITNHFNGGN